MLSLRTFDRNIVHSGAAIVIVLYQASSVAVLVPQSHLFLIGAGGLLWRFMSGGRVALCCIAGVWALGGAFQETLKQGQLSPLLVLLLVISI